jgi:hypothetical protein
MRIPLVLAAVSLCLPACQARRLFPEGGTGGGGPAAGGAHAPRGGEVNLTARDLAPVDAWVSAGPGSTASNTRWILGDEVTIEASREYFGPKISINARTGAVQRTDVPGPDETVTTLTFMMGKYQAAVENNPRVMIDTGITVSARRVLKLRLVRTTDPATPVRLRITATGDASRGHKTEVQERAPSLQMGGSLRWTGAAWVWQPIGGPGGPGARPTESRRFRETRGPRAAESVKNARTRDRLRCPVAHAVPGARPPTSPP